MRYGLYILLAAGGLLLAAPGDASAQGGVTSACVRNRCVMTSATLYNSCVDLALDRGQTLGRGDRYSFDSFVQACVRGRVQW